MERNEVRRNLLLGHIQNVEEQMLKLLREERDRKSKQLQNLQDAEAKNMKKNNCASLHGSTVTTLHPDM